MLAFAGFAVQAYTGQGTPLAALGKHLSDPWNNTVWNNGGLAAPTSIAPFSFW